MSEKNISITSFCYRMYLNLVIFSCFLFLKLVFESKLLANSLFLRFHLIILFLFDHIENKSNLNM